MSEEKTTIEKEAEKPIYLKTIIIELEGVSKGKDIDLSEDDTLTVVVNNRNTNKPVSDFFLSHSVGYDKIKGYSIFQNFEVKDGYLVDEIGNHINFYSAKSQESLKVLSVNNPFFAFVYEPIEVEKVVEIKNILNSYGKGLDEVEKKRIEKEAFEKAKAEKIAKEKAEFEERKKAKLAEEEERKKAKLAEEEERKKAKLAEEEERKKAKLAEEEERRKAKMAEEEEQEQRELEALRKKAFDENKYHSLRKKLEKAGFKEFVVSDNEFVRLLFKQGQDPYLLVLDQTEPTYTEVTIFDVTKEGDVYLIKSAEGLFILDIENQQLTNQ